MNEFKNIILPISFFIISMFIFTYVSEIDEIVKGTGKIIVKSENKKIQHFEGGILEELYVKEGKIVKKGEKLLKIKNIFFDTTLKENELNQMVYNIELNRLDSLINETNFVIKINNTSLLSQSIIKKEKEIFVEDKAKIKQKILLLSSQVEQKILKRREIKINLINLKIEEKLQKEKFGITSRLYKKKSISKKEYISAKLESQKISTKIEELQNNIPIVNKEIEELESKKILIKKESKVEFLTKYNEIKSKLYQTIEKRKALLDRQKRMTILSPINGIINNIEVSTIGGTIKQGSAVLDIIPIDEEKIIEAEIFDKDRAKIWIGQKVNIEINAYPSTKYGYLKGEIIYISPDSYIKKNNNKVFYTIKINLKESKNIKKKQILTGMTTNVNILTGKKTIIEYIIKPLKYIKNNSFIEE